MNQKAERMELAAQQRELLGKQVRQLRQKGQVPGVMYGHDYQATPLLFDAIELRHVLARASRQVIGIRLAGSAEPEMALVREIQRDPITGRIKHVDLQRVLMTERVTAEVRLTFTGDSPAVRQNLGILLHGVSTIEVECLPGDLVDSIQIDIGGLNAVDASIHVRDLPLPEGMQLRTSPEEMVVRVVPLAVEEEVVAPVTAETGQVEVISAKKEETEE
jgi:large subunit ribosomal protein L25